MAIATSVLWLALVIVAVVAAAGVCLQIFLSWRESWWPDAAAGSGRWPGRGHRPARPRWMPSRHPASRWR